MKRYWLFCGLAAIGAISTADEDPGVAERIVRVKEVHGGAGPWAVIGYRIGERSLKELDLPRYSFQLSAVHRAPSEVQYSCVVDGLQAATGTSAGKLNLRLEEAAVEQMKTVVEDRKTGRSLSFTIRPELTKTITNLPHERLEAEGRRVAALTDDQIFVMTESKAERKGR